MFSALHPGAQAVEAWGTVQIPHGGDHEQDDEKNDQRRHSSVHETHLNSSCIRKGNARVHDKVSGPAVMSVQRAGSGFVLACIERGLDMAGAT